MKKGQQILLVLAGTVALVYGMIYVDVVWRAKEAYQEGEKYWRWTDHPDGGMRAYWDESAYYGFSMAEVVVTGPRKASMRMSFVRSSSPANRSRSEAGSAFVSTGGLNRPRAAFQKEVSVNPLRHHPRHLRRVRRDTPTSS